MLTPSHAPDRHKAVGTHVRAGNRVGRTAGARAPLGAKVDGGAAAARGKRGRRLCWAADASVG